MRNLILFIVKNYFILLFLLLQAISVAFIVQYNEPQGSRFIASSNVVYSNIYYVTDAVSQYFNLRTINKQLALENAQLRKESVESQFSKEIDPLLIKDTIYKQQYEFISAKVLNNSIHTPQNYITINKGRRHGVYRDMAVISPTGVVGIVKSVSENFAKVLSVLNTQYRVSAKFAKNNYYGSVYWNGKNYRKAVLAEIPYHVNVKEGDEIITNSYSNIYPSGIPIGKVSKFSKSDNDNFYTIEIELSTDFKNIEYVYVVQNLYKNEREILEEEIE